MSVLLKAISVYHLINNAGQIKKSANGNHTTLKLAIGVSPMNLEITSPHLSFISESEPSEKYLGVFPLVLANIYYTSSLFMQSA